MFHVFLLIISIFPSLISSNNRNSHIFNLIHRNREDEANSTRFSLFSIENSEGFFSFESLASHAFPCSTSILEWKDASIILLLPCQHNSIIDREALHDFKKSYPKVSIPSKCSPISGLELDFTAVEIRLNISLRLDGDKSIRIFSHDYSRQSKYLDRPIIQFSYVRKDEDCDISCDNANHSIFSTPSCIGQMISDNEIDVCDMMNETNCLWESHPPGKVRVSSIKFLRNQKYIRMFGRDETATFTSPYIAHTSINCVFIVDAFMDEEGSSMDISYSTRDGNNSNIVHLPESHTPFKLKPLSISIGHFFSPVKIVITCHKGSICHIDNLRLKNCEDDSSVVKICPPSSSVLCSSSFHSKCLSNDRICDLNDDCSNGEDEDNCDYIPSYGLCDFSSSSIWSFCSNWTSTGELNGISFGEANGRKGHSMKFGMDKRDLQAGRRMKFTSPKLPPTSRKVIDSLSPLYGSCTLRFSYCASNRWNWLDFIWKISGGINIWDLQEMKNITGGSSKCEWKRQVIQIPTMRNEYSLIFEIESTRRDSSTSLFEIADVSIAESCFINDTSNKSIPSVYNIWPCNRTGPHPPSIQECQRFYNETDEMEQLLIEKSGWMTWIAPNTNQYRLELCGASGSEIDGQLGGKAGCIVTIISLSYQEKLEIMIGQEGDKTCSKCESSSGGGATVIKKRDTIHSSIARTILVAGGGGGISKRIQMDREKVDGGSLSTNISTEELSSIFTNWETGDAFSHAFFPYFNIHCDQCESMDINSNRGGRCNNPLDISIKGGYGGGGSSCGESPGPGGGYIGGKRKHNKIGGTSYVFNQETLFNVYTGIHTGQGFVRIFPCSLSCSFNQSCVFKSANRGDESEMECECINGTNCIQTLLNDSSNLYIIMAVFFCVLAFVLLLYGINQHRNRSRDRIDFNRQIQEIEMINLDMIDIESFDCLDSLNRIKIPHIPRATIIFGRMLGKGAFGEVFHAHIQEDEDKEDYEVAVKTLSLTLDLETQIDFTFETLTLHKLNHSNIVRAIGINTEGDPYCLILEYMKGRDLLSFLRDYRKGDVKLSSDMNMGDILSMAIDVASGCEYLESNHYVHRDIAARNCLLTMVERGRKVKLADFGMARDVYSVDYYRKHGRAKMPVKWLPPESYLEGVFTSKADVWSYGVLLWEIFSLGHMPYPGLSNFEVMETVRIGKRLLPPNGTSTSIYSLMQSTWRIDDNSRPSFKQILSTLQTMANDELETIKRCPPGVVPYGLMQTDDDGNIEKNYPNITTCHKKKEGTKEDPEDKSLLD